MANNNLPIIVVTSDKYRHLMPEFASRFNEYASCELNVTCLCYQLPPELPRNFSVVSLGEQPDGGDWTSGLRSYFLGYDSESRFILLLEDYFINYPFDFEAIMAMNTFPCDKFDLTNDRVQFPHWVHSEEKWLICSDQVARYRSSLQAAIWRVGYFKKFLVGKRTPWEFELKGEQDAMRDGATILGTTGGLIRYDNAMKMGVQV